MRTGRSGTLRIDVRGGVQWGQYGWCPSCGVEAGAVCVEWTDMPEAVLDEPHRRRVALAKVDARWEWM